MAARLQDMLVGSYRRIGIPHPLFRVAQYGSLLRPLLGLAPFVLVPAMTSPASANGGRVASGRVGSTALRGDADTGREIRVGMLP